MNPNPGIKVLHNLHVQSIGFHSFTLDLNSNKVLDF